MNPGELTHGFILFVRVLVFFASIFVLSEITAEPDPDESEERDTQPGKDGER